MRYTRAQLLAQFQYTKNLGINSRLVDGVIHTGFERNFTGSKRGSCPHPRLHCCPDPSTNKYQHHKASTERNSVYPWTNTSCFELQNRWCHLGEFLAVAGRYSLVVCHTWLRRRLLVSGVRRRTRSMAATTRIPRHISGANKFSATRPPSTLLPYKYRATI